MKIVVTGSLGNISKPLTEQLVKKGHSVTVVSRSSEKQKDIGALGAKAAIGSMNDSDFLASAFKGADAVYCMLSPGDNFFDPKHTIQDLFVSADLQANNYVKAIQASGVKRVIYLSTIGAHTDKDNGPLVFHYNAEKTLNTLPSDVSISFMRPVGFYTNLFNFIPAIKTQGMIASNYGGDDLDLLVSPVDIASAVVDELELAKTGRNVRYVASEEMTCSKAASIIGEAIGKPDLTWITISDEQLSAGMKAAGMSPTIADSFVEMNASIHNGKLYEDYFLHKPDLGIVTLKEFSKEFAAIYNQ